MQTEEKNNNILVGVCGSVAAIKLPLLVTGLQSKISGCSIKVIATENAQKFFKRNEVAVELLTDADEWATWNKIGDDVLHIELCKWANVMVIAPLDANTLAKIANGLCDNLLTCVVRAWRREKPLLFALAMNTFMYEHPLTNEQIDALRNLGYEFIPPVVKRLACGDLGIGAMASVEEITNRVQSNLQTGVNATS